MPVRARGDAADRDAFPIGHQRAFGALFAAVCRGFSGDFAAARRFDQATVDDEVFQVQSDDPVVGLQADLLQVAEYP
ncbi:hypothetical protein AARI_32640 [Glutamicibacter arilaitensis Re117]|uniref:Uncharacterized protein n=1 Tax=Glutamicibacter arilaitensis (strain DSM 16368 / CIP 108037 / IAM 15318 / JCM 13566 / NCIMB 14258 / Re117) TaxID=861360 RepID=A0ABP1U682_GLUAR|nr:hypothetical protein AARI_32640 [Glutamicibacter arilaitensis Re117]